MARRREFDMTEALDAAVEVFWRLGPEGTSVRALCDAMGIQPGSFYAAFGDKDACFRRAVGRYIETRPRPTRRGPAAIAEWLDAVVDIEGRPPGCLLVVAAVERAHLDPVGQATVTAALQAVEDFFWRCLEQRPRAREDAALLAATVAGLHVMARSGAPQKQLRLVADHALASVGIVDRPVKKS